MALEKGYSIRQYEPADRDGILALYERTFGSRSPAWFRWRYVDNPYLPEVPIHVAEQDGQVVAARPSLPIPLTVGDARALALMQVDPMVHPDHRRQGLFVRLASVVHDRYAAGEPTVELGFPNESALGALEKLESELSLHAGVRFPFPEFFRIRRPAAMVAASTDDRRLRALARLGTPLARGYLAARDALAPTADSLAVEQIDGVPPDRLAALADAKTPAADGPVAAHATRDAEFYRWRFANPRYDYRTYVASAGGTDRAAIVVGVPTDDQDDARVVNVSEVVPVAGGRDRDEAVSTLLASAADGDLDGLAAAGTVLPRRLLRSHGFRSRDSFPLSLLSSRNYLLARPLVEAEVEEWTVGGLRLADRDNWRLCYCEREIG